MYIYYYVYIIIIVIIITIIIIIVIIIFIIIFFCSYYWVYTISIIYHHYDLSFIYHLSFLIILVTVASFVAIPAAKALESLSLLSQHWHEVAGCIVPGIHLAAKMGRWEQR